MASASNSTNLTGWESKESLLELYNDMNNSVKLLSRTNADDPQLEQLLKEKDEIIKEFESWKKNKMKNASHEINEKSEGNLVEEVSTTNSDEEFHFDENNEGFESEQELFIENIEDTVIESFNQPLQEIAKLRQDVENLKQENMNMVIISILAFFGILYILSWLFTAICFIRSLWSPVGKVEAPTFAEKAYEIANTILFLPFSHADTFFEILKLKFNLFRSDDGTMNLGFMKSFYNWVCSFF